jgi:hypothetical protein
MAARPQPPDRPPAPLAGEPLDLAESVAGEEDPGASIDLPLEREKAVPASRDAGTPSKPDPGRA